MEIQPRAFCTLNKLSLPSIPHTLHYRVYPTLFSFVFSDGDFTEFPKLFSIQSEAQIGPESVILLPQPPIKLGLQDCATIQHGCGTHLYFQHWGDRSKQISMTTLSIKQVPGQPRTLSWEKKKRRWYYNQLKINSSLTISECLICRLFHIPI